MSTTKQTTGAARTYTFSVWGNLAPWAPVAEYVVEGSGHVQTWKTFTDRNDAIRNAEERSNYAQVELTVFWSDGSSRRDLHALGHTSPYTSVTGLDVSTRNAPCSEAISND